VLGAHHCSGITSIRLLHHLMIIFRPTSRRLNISSARQHSSHGLVTVKKSSSYTVNTFKNIKVSCIADIFSLQFRQHYTIVYNKHAKVFHETQSIVTHHHSPPVILNKVVTKSYKYFTLLLNNVCNPPCER